MKNIFTSDERRKMINKIEEIDRLLKELKTQQKELNEQLYAVKEARYRLGDQRRQLMNAYGVILMHHGNGEYSYILEEQSD